MYLDAIRERLRCLEVGREGRQIQQYFNVSSSSSRRDNNVREREEINVLEKNVNKRDLPVTVLSFSVYRVTVHCTHITISSTCMSLYLTLTKPFRRSKYIDIVTVFVSTNSSSFPMNDTAKNE